MNIEKLRNKNSKKYFLYGLILVVVLTITVTFIGSKANYRITASIPLTEGKVVSSPYDLNIVAMYIDGVEQDKDTIIPSGYKINEESSYCYKGSRSNIDSNAKLYTNILGEHVFSGISKSSKCILYLDKDTNTKTMNDLLKNHYVARPTRSTETKDFNVTLSGNTYGVVYEANDDDGITYYFAGNPLDNWVEFGGYYWRIIRVNGDGSIRIIYQGRTQDENGNKLKPQATGDETQIGSSKFNEYYNDNTYVGYMYGISGSTTYASTHENKNDSNAKKYVDNWFNNSNIRKGTDYFNKIDLNSGFCGDRQPSSSTTIINGIGGIGSTTLTHYGAFVRLGKGMGGGVSLAMDAIEPTFNCSSNDLYTYSTSNKGNKKLVNPVGLITADELNYAGMIYNTTIILTANYLYTGRVYFTMSPASFEETNSKARIMVVNPSGTFNAADVNGIQNLRPVINLRSDVTLSGDGTISNPYKVIV